MLVSKLSGIQIIVLRILKFSNDNFIIANGLLNFQRNGNYKKIISQQV